MNKQQEPRLRFKGFTGEWEDKKLGELILYLKGFAFKTENYKDSGIRIIRGLDLSAHSIKNNTDSVFIAISEYTKYQDWEIQENDIIVTTVGSKPHLIDSAVGRAIFVDKEKIGLLNQNLLILRNIEKETNSFIYANLLTQKFHKHIESIQRGNANQSNITVNDLLDFSLFCPPHKEQTTIGNFFRCLDSQIAENRAVLEKSRQLKKAMLAKMFPANGEKIPKIRFKGFEGEWEEKNFASVGEFNPKTEIPSIFQYVDLESVVGTQLISYREESKETAPSRAQRLAKNGDLFFQAVRPYQKNNYLFEKNNENFVFSTGYIQIRPQNDGYFLLTLVQKEEFVQEVLLRCTGTSYPAINASSLQDIAILTPQTSKEQIAIGNFFRQLDETIALQSAEVEKLNQLKKGLLAAMLV